MQSLKKAILTWTTGALVLTASACSPPHGDRWDKSVTETESRAQRAPGRDQFVGSVFFATGSSALSKAAAADLGRMANRIQERRHAGSRVVLIGYADRKRGVEENAELASERAQRVAMTLEKRGVELERIVIDSRNIRITRTQTAERRVDIYLENGALSRSDTFYPILVAFFLLSTFVLAVVIFRRSR